LAHADIAEKRLPQDGKFSYSYDKRTVDFRVSSFPAMHGEKIVVRILDRTDMLLPLSDLGMSSSVYQNFSALLQRPYGFVLVTGPTGSGKTSTLYASLSCLNAQDKNIVTLEDPVEYKINGITQAQINPEIGFTFARGIRAMLRQDPDIVMIGEIRDAESAQTAIDAALTGHMVFSTLHTNDAPAALMRLLDMHIEPFLINASVTGIVAQRLVRKLCNHCKFTRKPTEQENRLIERFNIGCDMLTDAAGCTECLYLGHKGRIGIFELLTISNNLRNLIVKQPVFETIYEQALHDGMHRMYADGIAKVTQGIISLAELMRVIY
jgi:type II secretory ATPase GspE/PulE/Tfp pilus assembly ATPase PilB-like protein